MKWCWFELREYRWNCDVHISISNERLNYVICFQNYYHYWRPCTQCFASETNTHRACKDGVAAQQALLRAILLLQYLYLDGTKSRKREKDEACWLMRSRTERGSHMHRAILGSRVRRYCKTLEMFMACIFFSSFRVQSSTLLRYTILGAIWLFYYDQSNGTRWDNYTTN